MNDLENDLKEEFQDEEYRYAYAESFLNTKIAAQVKTLREQRDETQAEVAARMGIKQPGYRRFEDSNHSVWKTDSLWDIARVYGVRLNISFETFGSLLEEKKHFSKEALKRPAFKDDPAFKEAAADEAVKEKELTTAKEPEYVLVESIPAPLTVIVGNAFQQPNWVSALNALHLGVAQQLSQYAGKTFTLRETSGNALYQGAAEIEQIPVGSKVVNIASGRIFKHTPISNSDSERGLYGRSA